MQIIFEDTIRMATFVAPDGIIYYSRLIRVEVNQYDYVADGNGISKALKGRRKVDLRA